MILKSIHLLISANLFKKSLKIIFGYIAKDSFRNYVKQYSIDNGYCTNDDTFDVFNMNHSVANNHNIHHHDNHHDDKHHHHHNNDTKDNKNMNDNHE